MSTDSNSPNPTAKSNYKPILLTLLFSFLLGGGSCFGFLTTLNMNRSTTINTLFGIGFGVCLLVFVVSILWLAIKAVRAGLKGGGKPQ
jgi:hypothetical protein